MLPWVISRATKIFSGGRSRSSPISRSIERSAAVVWVARVITAAIPAIGPSTRPASMLAATSAPTDN